MTTLDQVIPKPLSTGKTATSPKSRSGQDRLGYIDALRGFAALYVVIYHLVHIPKPNLSTPYWAKPLILSGGSGVTLFFIISAFTLCYSMRVREGEPRRVFRFYVRRFFRIVPLFYLWIIVSWLRDFSWYGVMHSPIDVLLSLTFTYNFIPGKESGFVWASWTLGVEMIFYLFFPIIFRYVNDYCKALAFFLFTLVLAAIYTRLVLYLPIDDATRSTFLTFSFLHMLPVFACGILAFFIFEKFIQGASHDHSWSLVLLGGAAFGYSALLSGRLNVFLENLYWQAIIYSILVLGLTIAPWRLFINQVTLFYGAISYSLYLNHPTLVSSLEPLYHRIYTWPLPVTIQLSLCLLVTVTLLTLISYLTYRFIEQPGMRIGSWLIYRIVTPKKEPVHSLASGG